MKLTVEFEGFEGSIILDTSKYRERMKNLQEVGISIDSNGNVEISKGDALDNFVKYCTLMHKQVKKVNLIHKKSGIKFINLEELEEYSEYQDVITKLIEKYNEGMNLGNVQKKELSNK